MFSLKKRSHALRSKLNQTDAQMTDITGFPLTLKVKHKACKTLDEGRLRWKISHLKRGIQIYFRSSPHAEKF